MTAAQHEGIAEVRHAFDEADEEGVRETRLHQRKRNVPEGPPAVGPQRLRGFLHRGGHAFHDPDQDEERDRREGEDLCDPDTGKPIQPPARLDSEEVRQPNSNKPCAAEQQRQRQADDEGRRDDRQDGEEPQALLESESRPGCHESEGKTEKGRAGRGHDRKKEGSPRDTAASFADHAVQAPDGGINDVAEKAVWIEGTVEVLEGSDKHAGDRIEDKDGHQEDQQRNGADDEGVALHHSALCAAKREDEDEDDRDCDRAGTHGGLPGRKRSENCLGNCPGPTRKADRQALQGKEQDAKRADPCQHSATLFRLAVKAPHQNGSYEQKKRDGQPPAAVKNGLKKARGNIGATGEVGQP